MKKILKEEIEDIFKDIENTCIYISTSLKNMEYYEYILGKKGYNVTFFKTNVGSKKELIDINVRLINLLNEKKKNIIFIDFSLAMSIFFDKYDSFTLEVGKDYNLNKIEEKLQEYAYEKNYLITEMGQYSRRGDLIDVYSATMDNPIRLDFFDVELEKIKIFDIDTQRSYENLKEIQIYSNILKGDKVLITELTGKTTSFFIENLELVEHSLETMLLLDNNDKEKILARYEVLKEKSEIIEVALSENRNYQSEIEIKRKKELKKKMKYSSITELNKGDYVIHVEYGIGKYMGLKMMYDKEYLLIQYADDGELYVPVEKLYRIEKYINISNKEPELYKLGTKGFKKKHKKYKEEIEKVAKELIRIQAKRKKDNGICFMEDTVFQKQFEEKFEYLETEDQKKAIEDVKKDMQSYKIMDRIICGDVGYGKTEVAMRAAFKAIESGYQVALLAPTTILANQHYERFKKRFEDFPINIASYSRLSTRKGVLEDLISGKIDLLIGTHKILGDNVIFNNLGLLIIDEEQKFGVKHKEKIKEKKTNIDVLTLTATPIPRTLNLALLGIRDISVIATPPLQKLPIKTEILNFNDEEKLKKVILEEIKRDGQVFYISNDVKGMEDKVKYLKTLLPSFIGIEYIHGQLSAKEIKGKIDAFEKGEFQVLVASTIIENGIDIANANTIIIEGFNNLGLSQIYQLRGRVGRSKRQAYCYLLKSLKQTQKGLKKQESISEIENISSGGYVIAMEDMNIRGAGEILGNKQHGAIESFGYDLYIKLLNEEIKRQKGEITFNNFEVKMDLKDKGYIPNEYIKETERIKIYKRIVELTKISEVDDIKDEIEDRFGKIPKVVNTFLDSVKIKIYCQKHKISRVEEKDDFLYFYFTNNVLKLSKKEVLEGEKDE